MNEQGPSMLTPEQAADVVHHLHASLNHKYQSRGWKDKVPLGEAAIRSTIGRYSLLPTGEPMLTIEEASAGLKFIKNPPEPERSDEYYRKLEDLVDKGFSYDDARRRLED